MSDLAYLLTAQLLVKRDKEAAMSRLGIGLALAESLEQLSPRQLTALTASRSSVDLSSAGIPAGESPVSPRHVATICH